MPRNLRDLLSEHEAELTARLKALHAQIIPLERELADVRRARGAVALVDFGPEQPQIPFPSPDERALAQRAIAVAPHLAPRASPYARLTIKQLVIKALEEQFERGATAAELLEFFGDAWGRQDIVRTSLSPQLSRLKQEGQIILLGQRWSLPTTQNRPTAELETKAAAD